MQSCEHLIYLVSCTGVRGGDETYESIARKGEAMTLRHGYVRLRRNRPRANSAGAGAVTTAPICLYLFGAEVQ